MRSLEKKEKKIFLCENKSSCAKNSSTSANLPSDLAS